jgi:hypothetical protein
MPIATRPSRALRSHRPMLRSGDCEPASAAPNKRSTGGLVDKAESENGAPGPWRRRAATALKQWPCRQPRAAALHRLSSRHPILPALAQLQPSRRADRAGTVFQTSSKPMPKCMCASTFRMATMCGQGSSEWASWKPLPSWAAQSHGATAQTA